MKQRIITGVAAGALYLFFLFIGFLPFSLLATVIAVISYVELASMRKFNPFSPEVLIGAGAATILVLNPVLPIDVSFERFGLIVFMVLSILLLVLSIISVNRFSFPSAAYLFFAAFYIGIPFHLLVQSRDQSLPLILFIQLVIWATDSGAYFIGRKVGRHKLAPTISPNKTREGFAGGIAVAFIFAFLMKISFGSWLDISWWIVGMTALVISVFGQLGDLAESAVKRYCGVKDSGKILPGHGGLLDRFDSLIFVLPVLYLLGVIR